MSRKKKRNRANQKQQNQQQQQKPAQKPAQQVRRYIIPLAEWKKYERFKDRQDNIDEALSDLQENWGNLVQNIQTAYGLIDSDFEEINDNIIRVSDIIRGIEGPRKSRRKVYHDTPMGPIPLVNQRPKKKYENMVAEIIIEDISDDGSL